MSDSQSPTEKKDAHNNENDTNVNVNRNDHDVDDVNDGTTLTNRRVDDTNVIYATIVNSTFYVCVFVFIGMFKVKYFGLNRFDSI